jgi:hypothetical protein
MINLFHLAKYTFLDLINNNKVKKDISGIWIFCGLYGQGKTLSMSLTAKLLHDKGYSVYSNYGLVFQTGSISSWKDLFSIPHDSVVCLDEISNLINSRDWKNMPSDFFSLLTQNRKMNIRIMGTAQVYDDVDKQFRTLVRYIVHCAKYGRVQVNTFYNQIGYLHTVDKRKSLFTDRFVVLNEYFDFYDTFEVIRKLGVN